MLLGKAQRSSGATGTLRHSATAVGLLPTVPSAGSEKGMPNKEPRRSDSALGAPKALHGSFTGALQGRLTSPRCDLYASVFWLLSVWYASG